MKAEAEVRQQEAQVDTEVYQPHVLGDYAVVGKQGARTVIGVDPRWMGRYCQILRSSTCWMENELPETGGNEVSESPGCKSRYKMCPSNKA